MEDYTRRWHLGNRILTEFQLDNKRKIPNDLVSKLSESWNMRRNSTFYFIRNSLLSGGEWAKLEKHYFRKYLEDERSTGEVRCQRMYDYLVEAGKTKEERRDFFTQLKGVCKYVQIPEKK